MNNEAVIEHIVAWMKDYVEKSRTKGFVVGVSGGIDSALTSTLAAKTGLPTLCLEMPIHQAASQVTRAREHISELEAKYPNVSSVEVDLTPVFDQFIASLPAVEKEEDRFLSLANARARLRMTSLYYFAGLHNYIVAGTGNKVEDFGVGFYTKYGDGGVDISPIADLMKTEVFSLAKTLGVIEAIQVAKPTDGLWGDDRSDEDQIGASYPELEWAMEYDSAKQPESSLSEREKEVLAIYTRLNRANQHKMNPIPVCEIPADLKA
ncbi:NAD(+) synthase [Leucothrix pacifica]|uniref:NH(3)-dependent NAD(+) synthetase n=1 Tax=Leucothrix pacifica TaxID=1247513 RepID=A0A317CBU2_9GAMM|nr:NAD(+) synthase [Leucothrix pacifica]PWQ95837.1 NAD(+) synthase [Leucothrix pacifica]